MGADVTGGQLDLLLLGVLAAGGNHGYAVITALRERSGGQFDLAEGSVYPALHRLEARGLLESRWEPINGRRRRIYSITDDGSAALHTQQRDWRSWVAAVESVLEIAPAARTA
jgi:DNA-binding PadR family transcriptional regulator